MALRPVVRRRTPRQKLLLAASWLIAAACVANVFPIYWMVATSLKSEADIHAYPPLLLFPVTLENYRELFVTARFFTPMRNSLVVAIGSTVGSVVLGSMAAYALGRFKVGGRVFPFWILAMRMFPPIVLALPVFFLASGAGLLNSQLALIAVYQMLNLPFVIWLMRGFFMEIPLSLEEAAWIDGCSRWQAMVRVVLPLARPGLAVTSIFVFIASWNEFLLAAVLTGPETRTAPVAAAQFSGEYGILWGPMMAAGTVIVLPMLAAAMLVQRYIVRGLALGAVKG